MKKDSTMKLFVILCCAMLAIAAAFSIDLPESRPETEVQSMQLGSINEEERPTPSVEPSADTEQEWLESKIDDAMLQEIDETAHISTTYGQILKKYQIRSFIWYPRLHVTFYNRSPGNLNIYWVNYSGQCVRLSTVGRNGGCSYITYESHAFVATTGSGQVRGIYIMYGRNAAVAFY